MFLDGNNFGNRYALFAKTAVMQTLHSKTVLKKYVDIKRRSDFTEFLILILSGNYLEHLLALQQFVINYWMYLDIANKLLQLKQMY